MKLFEVQNKELSGFGLAGWRQENGNLKLLGSNRIIPDWPEEIILMGNTYTLEDVTFTLKADNAVFEAAEYV